VRKAVKLVALMLVAGCIGTAGTLFPGEVATYTFTTDPTMFPCPGPCDTLLFALNYTSLTGAPAVTAQLFNGTALLGTYTSPGCCGAAFDASGSRFALGSPPIVDFTAILNDSIMGSIDYFVTGGSIVGFGGAVLELGTAGGTSSFGAYGDSATLTGLTISPEPSSALLAAIGFGLIAAIRNPSNRQQDTP
jgi:hypothetical protein